MKPAIAVSIVLLALVAAAQLVRLRAGWPVAINVLVVQLRVSGLLALAVGMLALILWRELRQG